MIGYPYTWAKSRGTPSCVEECLDRCFVTEDWLERYAAASLHNLVSATSDHTPLLLTTEISAIHPPPRGFRFENTWLSEPNLRPFVEECWLKNAGAPLMTRLTACSRALHTWAKELALHF
ncbi:hypothetical protein LINGRAPRIM_LOCUS544 [Linum grandiflorum]